jgi:hypothetical protein
MTDAQHLIHWLEFFVCFALIAGAIVGWLFWRAS